MIDQGSVPSLLGSTVRDASGDKIGKVGQVYLDDTTGMPEWVTVKTGLFGTRESFVPLAAAHVDGDELVVDVTKDRVGDAPQIDEEGHLSEEQEAELYRYYGVDPGPFGKLPDDDLAEPSAGAVDDSSGTAVGTLERPGQESLADSGYAAGSSGVDPEVEYAGSDSMPAAGTLPPSDDPALAAEGDPALDPTLDPRLDAELDRNASRDTDIVAAIDPDSPALGGPGSGSSTPGEQTATPAEEPPVHLPPHATTSDAYEVSRHQDAMTVAEEKAGNQEAKPGKSRLRRWIAGDS